MSDNYGEGATGCSQQRPEKSLHKSGEKSATGGIKTNRSTWSYETQRSGDFKLSVAKPSTSTSDPIGRSISLNQPKPYSLGKKFHVMVIGIRGILKACWHNGTEDESVYDYLITLLEQPAYRALQLLRIPESTSYQGFLERIATRFDSGKSTGACKMLICARQQKQSVCWKAVGTGRKRLLWCRLSIQRTRERPVLKGSSRSL